MFRHLNILVVAGQTGLIFHVPQSFNKIQITSQVYVRDYGTFVGCGYGITPYGFYDQTSFTKVRP